MGIQLFFVVVVVCLDNELQRKLWKQEPADAENGEMLTNRKSMMIFSLQDNREILRHGILGIITETTLWKRREMKTRDKW